MSELPHMGTEEVRIGRARLIRGDCRDLLPGLRREFGSRAVIISDPPYGIGFVRGRANYKRPTAIKIHSEHADRFAGVRIAGDDEPFDPAHLIRFDNVLLWGTDHYAASLPEGGRWLAWDKLVGKPSWDSFCDVEFAWHNRVGASRIFSYRWKGIVRNRTDPADGLARLCPAQKPVRLMEWCIREAGGPPGSLIIDPYMGCGTTGVAAIRLGYDFIGMEIDETNFASACARLMTFIK